MNQIKHMEFSKPALHEAKERGVDYTFSFGTSDHLALNLESSEYLADGYSVNLTVLKATWRSLYAEASCTPQFRVLYEVASEVDSLWIQLDPRSREIIGRWRAGG